VWLHNPEWDYTQFTVSDADGYYQFSALTGWHRLSVDGLGYALQDSDVLIVQNQDVDKDIEIDPMQESALYFPLSANTPIAPLPGCP
jgi:hypothetical protein